MHPFASKVVRVHSILWFGEDFDPLGENSVSPSEIGMTSWSSFWMKRTLRGGAVQVLQAFCGALGSYQLSERPVVLQHLLPPGNKPPQTTGRP